MSIRVAVANDYEVVVAGVAAMLAAYPEQVRIVELNVDQPVTTPCDVVLYDSFGQAQADRLDVDDLLKRLCVDSGRVVIYSWNVADDLVARADEFGVAGYLSKAADAATLVSVIERVHAGETVRLATDCPDPTHGRWPGEEYGLTARESEVLALICQGLSNEEIGGQAFLGVNTIKTHIRHLYRKIDVTRRSQAVIWGLAHGFEPPTSR